MAYAPLPTTDQLAVLAAELSSSGSVRFVRRIEGGISCTTDVVSQVDPSGGERKLVLRRLWDGSAVTDAKMEFDALSFLHRSGVRVPEPVWLDKSEVFDRPALVVSYVDGVSHAATPELNEQARQMAVALAELHRAPLDADVMRSLRDSTAQELQRIKGLATEKVSGHPLGQRLWQRMRVEADRVEFDGPVFTHGDFWRGNVLWSGDRLVAIVDFEDCGIGDPAADVAGAMNDLRLDGKFDAAEALLETYRAETGRSLASLNYWLMHELRRPMPDVASWLPTFKAIDGSPNMTVEELRARHTALIEEFL